jgi:methionyl-tRNA synthetase
MSAPFYVTTPIYYPSGDPHIGSAYTTTYADTLVRYHRAMGETSFMLTGTDEHGEKIAQAAEERGLEPQAFVDEMASRFQTTWEALDLRYDRFIRTTDADHKAAAAHFMQVLYDAGSIELRDYTGAYCVGCERYLVERELVDGKCDQHGTEPETRSEANYFFKMTEYFDWWIAELERRPELVTPARYRNEVLSIMKSGAIGDLCITRPKQRLTWGVTAPFDDKYVLYVWTDALVNYLSGIGYPDDPTWEQRWAGAHHITAKDILKPHAIFWPTMLRAAGLPLYQGLHVHGYWNRGDKKISKSLPHQIHPFAMRDAYGWDAFRYYMLREMSFGSDCSFSEEGVVRRINDDLGNDLGNLLNRAVSMLQRYFDGVVPDPPSQSELAPVAERIVAEVDAQVRAFSTQRALAALWELVAAGNKFIDSRAPWQLAKDEARRDELGHVMYEVLEALRVIAVLLEPFMPATSPRILESLGNPPAGETLAETARWGGLVPGSTTVKIEALFPRIEVESAS